jgi:hypothetical protein
MITNRAGGISLIVSAIGFIITMALHPTTAGPGAAGVHAFALTLLPVAFIGALALSRRLETLGALVTYGFGVVAVMNAAIYSGFVATTIGGQTPDFMWYTHFQNQAFALVYVVASCAAIVLWSIAMLKAVKGIAIGGLIIGPLIIIAVLSHKIDLGVHGFGAIVLAQAAWFVASGVWLIRLER